MPISRKTLIKEYVEAIQREEAAIFAGAGLSIPAGFVNWKELLRDIAESIELDVEEEYDLIALAQYYENDRNRGRLNQVLIDEFAKSASITKNHEILASMPIRYYWTTNFDKVIEKAIERAGKTPDVKISLQNLALSRFKADAVIYKMHGDVSQPHEAIITKEDFETFEEKKSLFSLALRGDLVTKTFLFLGYSFNDPNLFYILSKIRSILDKNSRPHYCIMRKVKREDFVKEEFAEEEIDKKYEYAIKQQRHRICDLKRYNISTHLVDDYSEITEILKEIQTHVKRKTIFISGAATTFADPWNEEIALGFVQKLSFRLSELGYKIVTGFGYGIGSSVINGVLENIKNAKYRNLDDHLIMRPFPQVSKKDEEKKERNTLYRREMLKHAGITIFLFGNKHSDKGIIESPGMQEEFDIAVEYGIVPLPIGCTGWKSKTLWEIVNRNFPDFYTDDASLYEKYKSLNIKKPEVSLLVIRIVEIIEALNKIN